MRRFACTLCGKCCNRSPEVQLSEAAALADVFVFRLMFRLYSLPSTPGAPSERTLPRANASQIFHQSKRLLGAHAAATYPVRVRRNGKTTDCTQYLMISALTLDAGTGACSALSAGRCSIHDRRPLSCRTVPFHYSRVEALAESDFDAFVSTPGYECDTGEGAPVVLDAGRIVDGDTNRARADALALAGRDRQWKKAIVRRMKAGDPDRPSLPTVHQVRANAAVGATTTSMRIGWQVAAEAGLLDKADYRRLIAAQLATIDRELAAASFAGEAGGTLAEMRADYWRELNA